MGLDWKARAGTPRAAVAGIGNGWLRYLPHARDFADPLAHHHYEVLSSLFAPGTCEELLRQGKDLLAELNG